MSRQLENNFRKRFCDHLTATYGPDVYQQKHHGSEFSAGLPDTLVLFRGRPVFIEFKAVDKLPISFATTNGMPTKLQLDTLRRIHRARGEGDWEPSYVATYIHYADALLFVPYEYVQEARNRKLSFTHENLMRGDPFLYTWKALKERSDWFELLTKSWGMELVDAVSRLAGWTPK